MTATRLFFAGKQQVGLETFEPEDVADDQVRVRTICTLMSTGTENIVFNRLFEEGTHWDNWVRYPFYPGYAAIGEIVEMGSAVDGFTLGQRVAIRKGHASEHVVPSSEIVAVPDSIDSQSAAWFALAKIAFMGARAAQYELGDTLLIVGAGPIGQMSVRWAAAAGLGKIVVVDPVKTRLPPALAGGATAVVSQPISDCRDEVMAAFGGEQPKIVNDATGNAAVFAASLAFAAMYGRIVILGDTGSPAGQHLTSDVISRGLTIIGAHDGHNNDTWNSVTITQLFFDLVRRGRFDLSGLNTHVFTPSQAAEAYETANARRGETMGIIFTWANGSR